MENQQGQSVVTGPGGERGAASQKLETAEIGTKQTAVTTITTSDCASYRSVCSHGPEGVADCLCDCHGAPEIVPVFPFFGEDELKALIDDRVLDCARNLLAQIGDAPKEDRPMLLASALAANRLAGREEVRR